MNDTWERIYVDIVQLLKVDRVHSLPESGKEEMVNLIFFDSMNV